MKRFLKHLSFQSLVCVLLLLISSIAFAQGTLPPPVANNPNPANLVGWCAFGYMILAPIVSVFTSSNTLLPFSLSTKVIAFIASIGGVIEGILLAIYTAIPWQQALLMGLGSAVTAFATHGARPQLGSSSNEAAKQKSGKPSPAINHTDIAIPPTPGLPKDK
jgi:hypothetical protein